LGNCRARKTKTDRATEKLQVQCPNSIHKFRSKGRLRAVQERGLKTTKAKHNFNNNFVVGDQINEGGYSIKEGMSEGGKWRSHEWPGRRGGALGIQNRLAATLTDQNGLTEPGRLGIVAKQEVVMDHGSLGAAVKVDRSQLSESW